MNVVLFYYLRFIEGCFLGLVLTRWLVKNVRYIIWVFGFKWYGFLWRLKNKILRYMVKKIVLDFDVFNKFWFFKICFFFRLIKGMAELVGYVESFWF